MSKYMSSVFIVRLCFFVLTSCFFFMLPPTHPFFRSACAGFCGMRVCGASALVELAVVASCDRQAMVAQQDRRQLRRCCFLLAVPSAILSLAPELLTGGSADGIHSLLVSRSAFLSSLLNTAVGKKEKKNGGSASAASLPYTSTRATTRLFRRSRTIFYSGALSTGSAALQSFDQNVAGGAGR